MNIESISFFQKLLKNQFEALEKANQKEGFNNPDTFCEGYFVNWKICDPEIYELEEGLRKIREIVDNCKKQENRLEYHLFVAKLEYHKGRKKSIELFQTALKSPSIILRNQLYNLNDYLETNDILYWHREYLRALVLGIDDDESLKNEVQKYIIINLDLGIIQYYKTYKNADSLISIQSVIEECIWSVADCIAKSKENRDLYQLLWSILIFKKDIIFWRSDNGNFLNQFELEGKLLDLRKKLVQRYLVGNLSQHEKEKRNIQIKDCSFDIRSFQIPKIIEKSLFKLVPLPIKQAVVFHVFTTEDKRQEVLVLTVGDKYELKVIQDFYQILEKIQELIFYVTDGSGYINLLEDTECNEMLYSRLLNSLQLSQISNSYNDGLLNLLTTKGYINTSNINKKPSISLYLDGILFQFPFEFLHNESQLPLGINNNLSTIINKNQDSIYINKDKGVLLFSEVPTVQNAVHLRHTKAERVTIERVCKENNTKIETYTEEKANKVSFIQRITDKSISIIHIAVHGIADESMPYDASFLILNPVNQDISTGLLTYHDILQLDLSHIDLVVLSGCNTAIGEVKKGSPMQGLAYSFLAVGVKIVIASRAEVRDISTNLIMGKFYENVFKNNYSIQDAFRITLKQLYNNHSIVETKDLASWTLYS